MDWWGTKKSDARGSDSAEATVDDNIMTSPLPPLSSLPTPTYPPSSYPPPSYFESPTLAYPALVFPSKRTGEIQKGLGDLVFKQPKRKSVYPPEEGLDYAQVDVEGGYDVRRERKLVLNRLGGDGGHSEVQSDRVWIDPRVASLLNDAAADTSDEATNVAPSGKQSVRKSSIQMSNTPYDLLTVDQALRRIMPTAETAKEQATNNGNPLIEEVPSAFEIAGHIAHVNLRTESLPYKYLIGRAILDKNRPRIRVVVNKVGEVEGEFRTFPMEILAGEGLELEKVETTCMSEARDGREDSSKEPRVMIGPQHRELMEVEVREHGCRFKLDFARVYFNSRLQGEHERLVQEIIRDANTKKMKECIVADAMAGVGPFAVPLTSANAPHYRRTKVVCHANDLNPVSYEYLQTNARTNKCFSDRLITYNLDAREFIQRTNEEGIEADHFIMNLPASAPEFLDAFRGFTFKSAGNNGESCKRPTVHVHCFDEKAKGPEEMARVEKQVQERCERALGCSIDTTEDEFRARVVRDVGPRKNMLCASFMLPLGVPNVEKLVLRNENDAGGTEGSNKRERESEGGAGIGSLKKSKES